MYVADKVNQTGQLVIFYLYQSQFRIDSGSY